MTEVGASWEVSAASIAAEVREGRQTASAVVETCLEQIQSTDDSVRAYLEVFDAEARSRAEDIDRRRQRGETLGALAGVPVAIKDNLNYDGHSLTCGSKILDGYRAPFSATAVRRLLAADAIIVGRVNQDEFAMGSSCENSAHHPSHNPWHLGMVPGGSSGGSAAAVASASVPLALGSDTGGSIRQPAALCGLVGLKPTWGRVSRFGLVAFGSSLDQIGPLSRNVQDSALALEVIAGHDERDATSADRPVGRYSVAVDAALRGGSLEGQRIGVLREVETGALAPDVLADWERSLRLLEEAGAVIEEVSVPNLPGAVAAYYVIANSEASANLARFDGARYGLRVEGAPNLPEMYTRTRSAGFGTEVKRRIMLGTFALSSGYCDAYYNRARGVSKALATQFEEAFSSVDALITPTTPSGAFGLGERTDDPVAMYLSDIFTTPASLSGLPAISIPSGLDARGLPLSVQLIAPLFEEERLLGMAALLERELDFVERPRFRDASEAGVDRF